MRVLRETRETANLRGYHKTAPNHRSLTLTDVRNMDRQCLEEQDMKNEISNMIFELGFLI